MGKKGMNPVVFNVPNSIAIFPILEFTILFDMHLLHFLIV